MDGGKSEAFFGTGESGGESGAITPGEIEAEIPRAGEDLLPWAKAAAATEDDAGIYLGEQAEEWGGSGSDGEGDFGLGISGA